MLTKKELTPQEVVGVAIDVMFAGVDTVSYILIEVSFLCDYNMYQGRKGMQCFGVQKGQHFFEKLYEKVTCTKVII